MKLPKFNQHGITHILAPIAFIGIFAAIGGIVLVTSHAQTPSLTVFTVFKETAKGKLSNYNGAKKISLDIKGKTLKVIKLAPHGSYNKNLGQTAAWDDRMTLDDSFKIKGARVRSCVHVLYPKSGTGDYGTIGISLPVSDGLKKRNLLRSDSFQYACTPYQLLQWEYYTFDDSTPPAWTSFINVPVATSWSQTAYVLDMKIQFAKPK